ncbi:hypothetical protein O6H91_22G038100 [Diphasiastrum complanatum]|uniref:Uncharacterized protein n=2 Tax=Diphasiastrum complanatum TaxID=34168 RepID=A0ACC2AEJ7_DIPCM|nr:hypothetical protein O6H91_22G037900 [Diphasiastrum complanatum]KAJ7516003.1 hypothetical protein O6H91_22G038100 [Diphasiastrum complanatum]
MGDDGLQACGVVMEARAPGKVILCGEHAVVHGATAVAAAIGLYTHARIHLLTGEDNLLVLDLPPFQVHLSWPLSQIQSVLDLSSLHKAYPQDVQSISESWSAKLKQLTDEQLPADADKGLQAGVVAYLFLHLYILGLQPTKMTVTSELPIGSGLGSSAAFCVSITGALLAAAQQLDLHRHLGPTEEGDMQRWLDVDDKDLDIINRWAFEGEKIIHGRPSGIDNTVSTFGYIVKFRQGQLSRIQTTMPLNMLLTNTKVGRDTKSLVAGVGARAQRHPKSMAAIFDAVDSISEEVVSILQSNSEESRIEHNIDGHAQSELVHNTVSRSVEEIKLEELVQINQGLLQSMGVSHPCIDAICCRTSKHKLQSKLTGAGGGGCVLTLLPHCLKSKAIEEVKADLAAEGFECFQAHIGGKGVQISKK